VDHGVGAGTLHVLHMTQSNQPNRYAQQLVIQRAPLFVYTSLWPTSLCVHALYYFCVLPYVDSGRRRLHLFSACFVRSNAGDRRMEAASSAQKVGLFLLLTSQLRAEQDAAHHRRCIVMYLWTQAKQEATQQKSQSKNLKQKIEQVGPGSSHACFFWTRDLFNQLKNWQLGSEAGFKI